MSDKSYVPNTGAAPRCPANNPSKLPSIEKAWNDKDAKKSKRQGRVSHTVEPKAWK